MLLNTENNYASTKRGDARAAQKAKVKSYIAAAEENCKFLADENLDPTLAQKRIGRPIHHDVLEEKLKRLNPNLVFVWNNFNSTKKCIFFKETHIPYEAGVMPERSIMSRKKEEVPIGDVYEGAGGFRLERGEIKDPNKNPWFRTIEVPWREEVRGWRTILLRLVASGAITPTQAETTFSAADNPEWQRGMGKAKHTHIPW